MRQLLFLLLLLPVSPLPAAAQVPALLRDFTPVPRRSTELDQFVMLNGTLYFGANPESLSYGLWRTDGTPAGTQLVRDSIYLNQTSDSAIVLGNQMFFGAYEPVHGYELWVSDGTTAGTRLLKDINPGSGLGFAGGMAILNGKLYFGARQPTSTGQELWVTDGTTAGTAVVKAFYQGSFSPSEFCVWNGKLYFQAGDSAGSNLWVSDGTAAGTVLLKDFVPNSGSQLSGKPQHLVPMGGKLYFSASDATHGRELWVTDGTTGGTAMVVDARPGPYDHVIGPLVEMGGKLYYPGQLDTTGVELCTADGTAAGTKTVIDLLPGVNNGFGVYTTFPKIQIYKGRLYFPGRNRPSGIDLWSSDGTAAGTTLVTGAIPGYQMNTSLYPEAPKVAGGVLYFSGADSFSNNQQLWRTDGTPAGTYVIRIAGGARGALQGTRVLGTDGQRLYYRAQYDSSIGSELYTFNLPPLAVRMPGLSAADVILYPNPASGVLHAVSSNSQRHVLTLYAITGQAVLAQELPAGTSEIPLGALTPGFYQAVLTASDGTRRSAGAVVVR